MCDTVKHFPRIFKIPILSSANAATRSALELTEALRHPCADLPYTPLSDNNITALKKISYIFTNSAITNPTLPSSSNPDTPKLQRVNTGEAGEATRVEEVQEEMGPVIKTERWHQRPSTHRYSTRYKAYQYNLS